MIIKQCGQGSCCPAGGSHHLDIGLVSVRGIQAIDQGHPGLSYGNQG